jgi:hypothetical protein
VFTVMPGPLSNRQSVGVAVDGTPTALVYTGNLPGRSLRIARELCGVLAARCGLCER